MIKYLPTFAVILTLSFSALAYTEPYQRNLERETLELFLSDLRVLKTLKFKNTSPLFEKAFPGGLEKFIEGKIAYLAFGGIAEKDDKVADYDRHTRTVTIYPRYYSLNLAQRLSFIIHETGHLHSGGHTICRSETVRIAGTEYQNYRFNSDCDDEIFDSYSLEYIFVRALFESCENCSIELKESARFSSIGYLFAIDNQEVRDSLLNNGNSDKERAIRDISVVMKPKNVCIFKTDSPYHYELFRESNKRGADYKRLYDRSKIAVIRESNIDFNGVLREGYMILVNRSRPFLEINKHPYAPSSVYPESIAKEFDVLWILKTDLKCY